MANLIMETLIEKFTTVVLAMHDVDLAIKFSTRIIGIKESAICFDQSTMNLTRKDLDFLYKHCCWPILFQTRPRDISTSKYVHGSDKFNICWCCIILFYFADILDNNTRSMVIKSIE